MQKNQCNGHCDFQFFKTKFESLSFEYYHALSIILVDFLTNLNDWPKELEFTGGISPDSPLYIGESLAWLDVTNHQIVLWSILVPESLSVAQTLDTNLCLPHFLFFIFLHHR